MEFSALQFKTGRSRRSLPIDRRDLEGLNSLDRVMLRDLMQATEMTVKIRAACIESGQYTEENRRKFCCLFTCLME